MNNLVMYELLPWRCNASNGRLAEGFAEDAMGFFKKAMWGDPADARSCVNAAMAIFQEALICAETFNVRQAQCRKVVGYVGDIEGPANDDRWEGGAA